MKNAVFFMLVILPLAAGCGSGCTKKAMPDGKPNAGKSPAPDSTATVTSPADASPVVISMQTTPCYGTCPVFKFEVLADNTAYFEGIRHVQRIGKYQSQASKAWQQQVVETATSLGFFSMHRQYPQNGKKVADFPMTITLLRSGRQVHKIENNFDAPLNLQRFEQYLMEKMEELEWVKM